MEFFPQTTCIIANMPFCGNLLQKFAIIFNFIGYKWQDTGFPINITLIISLFNATKCCLMFIKNHISTVCTINQWCFKFSIFSSYKNALILYGFYAFLADKILVLDKWIEVVVFLLYSKVPLRLHQHNMHLCMPKDCMQNHCLKMFSETIVLPS